MSSCCRCRRPRDSRFPRQSHRRMRRAAGKRRDGPMPPCRPGASTGSREAIELRDGDAGRYLGRACCRPSRTSMAPRSRAIIGLDAQEQAFIDKTLIDLDGTDNKSRLGANAMLAVSMAVAKAAAEESGLPLYRYFGGSGPMQMPVPMMNIINGGVHANNSLDIQEFMIMPVGMSSFREALQRRRDLPALKKLLTARRASRPPSATRAASPRTSAATPKPSSAACRPWRTRATRPAEDV